MFSPAPTALTPSASSSSFASPLTFEAIALDVVYAIDQKIALGDLLDLEFSLIGFEKKLQERVPTSNVAEIAAIKVQLKLETRWQDKIAAAKEVRQLDNFIKNLLNTLPAVSESMVGIIFDKAKSVEPSALSHACLAHYTQLLENSYQALLQRMPFLTGLPQVELLYQERKAQLLTEFEIQLASELSIDLETDRKKIHTAALSSLQRSVFLSQIKKALVTHSLITHTVVHCANFAAALDNAMDELKSSLQLGHQIYTTKSGEYRLNALNSFYVYQLLEKEYPKFKTKKIKYFSQYLNYLLDLPSLAQEYERKLNAYAENHQGADANTLALFEPLHATFQQLRITLYSIVPFESKFQAFKKAIADFEFTITEFKKSGVAVNAQGYFIMDSFLGGFFRACGGKVSLKQIFNDYLQDLKIKNAMLTVQDYLQHTAVAAPKAYDAVEAKTDDERHRARSSVQFLSSPSKAAAS